MILGASLLTTSSVTVSSGAILELAQTPTVVLRTGSIGAGGEVHVKDNQLIVTAQGVGTFDGSTYTGVSGAIRTGRNSGAWNGNGIMTSAPTGTLHALGVATAAQTGRTGKTFGGVTVSATDTLVMYTYAGDANLDGKINVDDYGRVDLNVNISNASGWFNGDFNYDGKVNVDDYGIIDFNVGVQGAPIPTAAQPLAGLATVPEPAAGFIAAISIVSMSALSRKKRARRQSCT